MNSNNALYPLLENVLIEWAQNNEYIPGERIWKVDLLMGKQVDYEFGAQPDSFIRLHCGAPDSKTAKNYDLDPSNHPEFSRIILTPTGVIEYSCYFGEKDFSSEEDLRLHLQNKNLAENYSVYHGYGILDWKEKSVSAEERKQKALVSLYFSADTASEITSGDFTILHRSLEMSASDPSYQMMITLQRLEQEWNPNGKGYSELDITEDDIFQYLEHLSMPNKPESYRIILDHIAVAIEQTYKNLFL